MMIEQKTCEECGELQLKTYGFNSSDASFMGISRRMCKECILRYLNNV